MKNKAISSIYNVKSSIFFLLIFILSVSTTASEMKADGLKEEIYSYTITETNPTHFDYPGGRGPNELILYSPKFGKNTGTNQWGSEAVVKNGIIISVGGNSNDIPEDGLVISGHGEAASWIQRHAIRGAKLKVQGKTVVISIDAETYIINAEWALKDARAALKKAIDE